MGFEVPPSPVRATRLGRPLLVFAAALVLIVAAAVATQPPAPAPPAAPSTLARASGPPAALVTPVVPPPVTPSALARHLPSRLACRQLDASTCRGLAQAALDVLPADAPPVTMLSVYRSLLCRDDLDCPPARLAGSGAPSGSVVIGFADGGPDAWVDVVTRQPSPGPGATAAGAGLEAWIIR